MQQEKKSDVYVMADIIERDSYIGKWFGFFLFSLEK